jgi:branched-subunit amino acid ABC-type transport system permease component
VDVVTNLLPHLVNGVSLGLLFALIALGFMLIVGVMETINLAHGSLFALGMYVALYLIAPKLPALQGAVEWYGALPIGTRYLIALLFAPATRRALRHASRAVHAANLREGPALRAASHVRRRARDRGADPSRMGIQREAAAAARAISAL